MSEVLDLSRELGIPEKELVRKGVLSYIEKELRLTEDEIANIRERYDMASKESLYEKIKSKDVKSHPAWEDYITWKNKENYIKKLKEHLEHLGRTVFDHSTSLLEP